MPALKRKRKESNLDLITNMDNDTMLEMMTFLNPNERRMLSQTCKRLRDVVLENNLLEYHLNEKYSFHHYNQKMFTKFETEGPVKITKAQFKKRSAVVDLKCLQGVKHIVFDNCHRIKNLNPISTSHTVEIRGSNNITNLGMMGNVNTLLFYASLGVTGFSLLSHVENLYLDRCSTLRNEDMINWNPRKLVLKSCSSITDLSRLSNIHHIELHNMRVTDLSPLANVHKLVVSKCNQATNFSALGAVMDLSIHNCQNLALEDLLFLSNVPKLSLVISSNLLSVVRSLNNLNLAVKLTCDYLTDEDLNYLINVRKLCIEASECLFLNMNCLANGKVQELSLKGREGLTSVSALSSIPILKIHYIESITDWGDVTPITAYSLRSKKDEI